MIFSRVNVDFTTRLKVNGTKIDKLDEFKVVGVWLTSDLKCGEKTNELSKRAYARISMLTKLRYVGVEREDLNNVCITFREKPSRILCCGVAFETDIRAAKLSGTGPKMCSEGHIRRRLLWLY